MCDFQTKLKEYMNIGKYFMVGVSDIEGCIQESQKCQKYLCELIEMKDFSCRDSSRKRDIFERFMTEKRDIIRTALSNRGVSYTEKSVDDRLIRIHADEYYKLKSESDDAKTNHEIVENLLMAMYQRKDLIKEYINYLRVSTEKEGCILNNKQFINQLKKSLGI